MRTAVILPSRGEGRYLAETLDSILDQRPTPDEVIVIDDGSPRPLTLEARHAGRCRLLRRERSEGVAAARDAGLAVTEAELIAPADDDDAWHPGKLEAQLDALARAPQAAVCFGTATVVDEAGRPTGECWPKVPAPPLQGASWVANLYERNYVALASAVIRRTALVAAGGFGREHMINGAEDWDLWLRLAAGGAGFVHEPRAVISYRRRPGSVTHDVAWLGQVGLWIHDRHRHLVDDVTARRSRARDLTLLARGRIRQRRYREARDALRAAAQEAPPRPRERLLAVAAALPGVRSGLGRRDPYRRLR